MERGSAKIVIFRLKSRRKVAGEAAPGELAYRPTGTGNCPWQNNLREQGDGAVPWETTVQTSVGERHRPSGAVGRYDGILPRCLVCHQTPPPPKNTVPLFSLFAAKQHHRPRSHQVAKNSPATPKPLRVKPYK